MLVESFQGLAEVLLDLLAVLLGVLHVALVFHGFGGIQHFLLILFLDHFLVILNLDVDWFVVLIEINHFEFCPLAVVVSEAPPLLVDLLIHQLLVVFIAIAFSVSDICRLHLVVLRLKGLLALPVVRKALALIDSCLFAVIGTYDLSEFLIILDVFPD